MDPADRLVPAVGTGHVRRLTGTRDRGERPVGHPDDLAEIDFRRVAGQQISPALPFRLRRIPWFRRPRRISSRNFGGICSARARSEIRTGSPCSCSARARSALIAYLALRDSMGGRKAYTVDCGTGCLLTALTEGQDLTPAL